MSQFQPSEAGPLVVFIPPIFGVTPDVKYCAELCMALGTLVYAIGPFWRDGNGPLRIPQNPPEAMACMKQIDDKMVLHELLSTCTREVVDDKCNVKLILLGVCFDGRLQFGALAALSICKVRLESLNEKDFTADHCTYGRCLQWCTY